MTYNVSVGILLLGCACIITTINCKKAQNPNLVLTDGAKKCFDKHIKGFQRRVKVGICDPSGRLENEGGFPFKGLEIRLGNVLFNTRKDVLRTILLKETTVQICMHGKVDTNRLRGNPVALQNNVHGLPESLPIGGIKLPVPLNVNAEFCDIDSDGCATTEPSCNDLVANTGMQEFCSCSTMKVPSYAPVGLDVQVTWKLLEAAPRTNTSICEQEFDTEKLWNGKSKQTLACLVIPSKIKECKELKPNSRKKIIGCQRNLG